MSIHELIAFAKRTQSSKLVQCLEKVRNGDAVRVEVKVMLGRTPFQSAFYLRENEWRFLAKSL